MERPSAPGAGNPADLTAAPYKSYRRAAKKLKGLGVRWAAPSFVVPGTVAANCRVLAGTAPEVGLLLFETRACLDYGEADLAGDLAGLGLTYHVHLPLDLPWAAGADAVWAAVSGLVEKTAHLRPWGFVLHPPGGAEAEEALTALARRWAAQGLDPADLLLENVEGVDPGPWYALSRDLGLSLCLDLGHLLAYKQQVPAHARDWARVRMLHLYAPGGLRGGRARHRPLPELDAAGRAGLRELWARAPHDAVRMIEVFELAGLTASVEWLAEWTKANAEAD